MNVLAQRIAAQIAAQGPISVAELMTIALHDPVGGYYATRDPLGAGGDFITAPEISQTFGEMLGLWCVQVWHEQARAKSKRLVELGPGRGTLMADVLRAARVMPEFLDGLEVVLVEASPALRSIQQETLESFGVPIRWVPHSDSSLGDRPVFLLANEFFDALPVRQFVKTARGWCERMVALDQNGGLAFALSPVPMPESLIPPDRRAVPAGGVYESSAGARSLVEEIARTIAHRGGAALIVDYGYDVPGFAETLQAVAHHSFTNVLDAPGEADLSAHVDFAALAAAASDAGAAVFGPIAQGAFLEGLGIVHRVEQLRARQARPDQSLRSGVGRLIDAAQMGTLFKALAILPQHAPRPPGF